MNATEIRTLMAQLARLSENGNGTASYWLECIMRESTVIGRAEVIARLEMDQRELLAATSLAHNDLFSISLTPNFRPKDPPGRRICY